MAINEAPTVLFNMELHVFSWGFTNASCSRVIMTISWTEKNWKEKKTLKLCFRKMRLMGNDKLPPWVKQKNSSANVIKKNEIDLSPLWKKEKKKRTHTHNELIGSKVTTCLNPHVVTWSRVTRTLSLQRRQLRPAPASRRLRWAFNVSPTEKRSLSLSAASSFTFSSSRQGWCHRRRVSNPGPIMPCERWKQCGISECERPDYTHSLFMCTHARASVMMAVCV